MSFIDLLFKLRFISEDTWRDTWQNKFCSFCKKRSKCRPWGAWVHQDYRYGGSYDCICKNCEDKKLK